jgi:starch synthase (maltosyl-transferring)
LERFSSNLGSAEPGLAAHPPRVIVESVRPEVDCGRFPVKRVLGEEVRVEADVFADGHDAVVCELLFKHKDDSAWQSTPMEFFQNDHWAASFTVERLGRYQYTVRGWTDPFLTWQRDLEKRHAAGQDLSMDFLIGAELAAPGTAEILKSPASRAEERYQAAMKASSPPPPAERIASYERALEVVVDPVKARFSSWYEMFPRSARGDGQHGTFRDCIKLLPYVASLGFDVLYLPPVHPIGATARKGRNNAVSAQPGDVGSPWAIGAKEGGHKAIHPLLGSFDDFHELIKAARDFGIDVALDIAFQCSPDHPYVGEHPGWFRWRPDGTVQYAENPPKKYQDIYPFEFDSPEFAALWQELKSVFEFWIGHGVKIFRVDNPHTKPFAFWEWAIAEIKGRNPEIIFLSEAFTRPRIMQRLAKLGFTQSYTYFTWRNTKQELIEYFSELCSSETREYFRPSVWPNTPDILHEVLQQGGRGAFVARQVLAATLAANYGIYGPAFELMEARPKEPGSEEYLNSEKYEIKRWDRDSPNSLKRMISRLNRIRREHPALQSDWSLRFHPVDNAQLVCYSKELESDLVIVVVNLDPHHVQSGFVELPLAGDYEVDDMLGGGRYAWHGARNYVELNPFTLPAHVFRVLR